MWFCFCLNLWFTQKLFWCKEIENSLFFDFLNSTNVITIYWRQFIHRVPAVYQFSASILTKLSWTFGFISGLLFCGCNPSSASTKHFKRQEVNWEIYLQHAWQRSFSTKCFNKKAEFQLHVICAWCDIFDLDFQFLLLKNKVSVNDMTQYGLPRWP